MKKPAQQFNADSFCVSGDESQLLHQHPSVVGLEHTCPGLPSHTCTQHSNAIDKGRPNVAQTNPTLSRRSRVKIRNPRTHIKFAKKRVRKHPVDFEQCSDACRGLRRARAPSLRINATLSRPSCWVFIS